MLKYSNLLDSTLSEISFEHKLSRNITLVKKVNNLLAKEIKKIKLEIDMAKYSSHIDYLLEADVDFLSLNYPNLRIVQSKILDKIKELNKQLASNVQDIPSYLRTVKNISSKKNRAIFDREIFTNIYVDEEISEDAANNLIDYFNIAISIVDPGLMSKISNVTLLLKAGEEEDFFSSLESNVISLTINEKTNIILLVAVLVHEVIHFIEFHNKNVNNLALDFIKQRAINVQKAETRRGRPSSNWKDVMSYDLKMDDPHSGYVYSNNLTEVLTTGVQNFILAPVLHLFKDPEYLKVLNSFFIMKEDTSSVDKIAE